MTPFLELALALAILITAAKLGGLLSLRLKQPSVLGELIAGLIVGYVPDFALFVVGLPAASLVGVGWHSWVLHGRVPVGLLVGASVMIAGFELLSRPARI